MNQGAYFYKTNIQIVINFFANVINTVSQYCAPADLALDMLKCDPPAIVLRSSCTIMLVPKPWMAVVELAPLLSTERRNREAMLGKLWCEIAM